MEELEKNPYNTASHTDELDFIFNQDNEDFNEIIFQDEKSFTYCFKSYYRFLRKKMSFMIRDKMQKNFVNIMYLTLDCPPYTSNSLREDSPLEYIMEMQKQYPDNDIRILMPIIGVDEETKNLKKLAITIDGVSRVLEKTSISFEFYLQNRVQYATVYKFPKNNSNIQVYGIYSPIFSRLKQVSELSRLHYLAPFLKAARIAIKKMGKEDFSPDIVHCENIPYFLGGEFDATFSSKIKVLQVVKDFTQLESTKPEAFWAAINLADKRAMRKICRDEVIKSCVAKLFNLHNAKRFYQMKDCLFFIYKNYYKFRKYIDKGEEIEENVIFRKLNARILKIFPHIARGEDLYFNPMTYSLKKADFWVTTSKTYYKDLFENPRISGKMFLQLVKTKEKSSYVSYGCEIKKFPTEMTRMIYECFSLENFRELRPKNKSAILKEFSSDRIKTNFVDPTLFKDSEVKIYGSLDSFYDAPILFANLNTAIFSCGADIVFNTILKLFELHKNIQVIVSMANGSKSSFVQSWLEFLSKNKYFNGRWVFIDGNVNLPKFLAASDMILLPRRTNSSSPEHYMAMRYGCVPIVSRSGTLNDSVSDIFDDISGGCGFKTKKSLLTEEDSNELFLAPVLKALNLYQNNPNSWNLLIKNCMLHDSSWNFKILERYDKIYKELI